MRRRRRNEEPELAPAVLTVTDPRTGAVITTETMAVGPEERAPVSRRWLLVGVGAVVALIAVGVVAAVVLRGAGGAPTGFYLPRAVTVEPSKAWAYEYDGDYLTTVTTAGDRVLVADDDGPLIGLDDEGGEAWTYDDHALSYVLAAGADDIAVLGGYQGEGVGGLAAGNGEELWWRDGADGAVWNSGELLLVVDDDRLSRLDRETGEEQWSADGVETLTVADDAVYVITDSELRRLDAGSGQQRWRAEVSSSGESAGRQLAANDALVVFADGPDVTAFDPADGSRLWQWTGSSERTTAVTVGVYDAERVYVGEADYDEAETTTTSELTVRDRDGVVDELPLAADDFIYGVPVEAGGTSYFLSLGSGALYDSDLDQVAEYSGDVVPTDSGVYVASIGELAYYPFGGDEPTWEISVDQGSDGQVYAADGLVLVASDGTLTAYR